jgi:hypothetical protein
LEVCDTAWISRVGKLLSSICLGFEWSETKEILETHKELRHPVAKDGKDMQKLQEDLFVNFEVKLRMTTNKKG